MLWDRALELGDAKSCLIVLDSMGWCWVMRRWDGSSGFFTDGIWALFTALQMMSFRCECISCLTAFFRQDRSCTPLASTTLPQEQVCSSQVLAPSRVPTDIQIISSVSLSSTAVMERHKANFQRSAQAKIRRVWSSGEWALDKKLAKQRRQ